MALESYGLSADELALLKRFSFDSKAFTALQQDLAAGQFELARNRAHGKIEPPLPGDILPWPTADSPEGKRCEAAGRGALSQGQVAVAILNGGMATRFGGRVKGVVEVTHGLSFLALKLRNAAAAPGPVHVFLMNSFATDKDTRGHLEANNYFGLQPERLHIVQQGISMRLTPKGELFRDAKGQVSFYAPGHGDLLGALGNAPEFQKWVAGGGKHVAISNVDNLGATLEPRVVGAHMAHGKPVTVEVAGREGGDTGGAPVRHNGKVEVLEGFRFPADFPVDSLPVFNTNTFVIDAGALRGDYNLTWFRADKKVEGQPVVQFERLMGEVTSFAGSAYLQVARQGPEGRFMPVKLPEDLDSVRDLVRQRFGL